MAVSHSVRNWALLAALVAMWGSAFMFVKLGVATVSPATLVAGRLAVGAVILYAVMQVRGLALPPPGRRWMPLAALALVGNCVPFYLITWGQQFIDSALAGMGSARRQSQSPVRKPEPLPVWLENCCYHPHERITAAVLATECE